MAERGHSLDSIKKSIAARKPDFDAYIDPQKKHADMIIQVRRGAQVGAAVSFVTSYVGGGFWLFEKCATQVLAATICCRGYWIAPESFCSLG